MSRVEGQAFLMHAGTYDPQKRKEYYERTKKLKGRRPGASASASPVSTSSSPAAPWGKPSRDKTDSRQAELRAQKAALEKRLDRLREVLKQLVDAAQARSGVTEKPDKSDSASEKSKADKNGKDKPLTQKQKREKADKAREEYEKNGGSSLSQDVVELKRQVQDIQAKIEKAVEDARDKQKRKSQRPASAGQQLPNPSGAQLR